MYVHGCCNRQRQQQQQPSSSQQPASYNVSATYVLIVFTLCFRLETPKRKPQPYDRVEDA